MKLHIDIETFCDLDLKDVGVTRYVQHPSFKIILFAWRFDDEDDVSLRDLYQGEEIPLRVWKALTDPKVTKLAHNAAFEIGAIAQYYGLALDPAQWRCTMIKAAYLGLPLSLEKVGRILHLSEQKDARGKSLITYFCQPVKSPKKKDGFRAVNLPSDAPEMWAEFCEYCKQDVRVECAVDAYADKYEQLPAIEWAYWALDQRINAAGVTVDVEFITAAMRANKIFIEGVHAEIIELTGVDNPNSLGQLKDWLATRGVDVPSLNKEYLLDVDKSLLPDDVVRLLELRDLSSKASISKYAKMLAYLCDDGRNHDLFQFYGANRTGREAGRGVQPQNLKKTFDVGLDTAREAVRLEIADLLYDDVPDLVSKLVRTAIVAGEGRSFCIDDFSAIEARVLAWLAGEDWVLDVFHGDGKLYAAQGARMFNVPIEQITKGSKLYAKSKIGTLALGYQGATGAMLTMGALREGLLEEELPPIVWAYRAANPKTVKLWKLIEGAAKHVVSKRTTYVLKLPYTSLKLSYQRGYLFIELPSGRRLAYYGADMLRGRLVYYGQSSTSKNTNAWVRVETYGGKLTENVTQAIARDCLFEAMYRMRGLDLRMHVHDEIVAEADDDKAEDVLKQMDDLMAISPLWAKDLPLEGDGFITKYYRKD